jgi:hypothetical protein
VRLTVHPADSELELPIRPAEDADELPTPLFGEPEGTTPSLAKQITPGEQQWRVSRDLADYRSSLEVIKDLGLAHFDDIDLDVRRRATELYSWVGEDFDSVRGDIEWTMGFTRGDWSVRTSTRTTLTSTATEFRLHAELDAYLGGERVFSKNWDRRIPRDHV